MKSVLISINRPYTDLISAERKQWEIRKNKPKIPVPFKCYIYETLNNRGCGFVVGEFICDEIVRIFPYKGKTFNPNKKTYYSKKLLIQTRVAENCCLTEKQLVEYLGEKDGYAWHISELKIYDVPKEIGEFHKPCYGLCGDCGKNIYWGGNCEGVIETAPQSWCYIIKV